jgi:NADH:ubiquinone oxidoreductase subunit 5 (subunit L)/multisubunit Na+/H+ antiporter MnhA subunit
LLSDIFLLGAFTLFFMYTEVTSCELLEYLVVFGGICVSDGFRLGVFFLIFSAAIKSVQLVGHLWLPDSMDAPLPASALIHSATLVSAGILLLFKFKFVIMLMGGDIVLC